MADSKTFVKRIVAGGELHMRKAPLADRWEISYYWRMLNKPTARMERELRWVELNDHPILHQSFATPDDDAEAVRCLLTT